MNPKEKAEEFYNVFYKKFRLTIDSSQDRSECAKQCSAAAADEIIKSGLGGDFVLMLYWLDVRFEIDNIICVQSN